MTISAATRDALPRVTYTNINADFTGLQAMLDTEIPAFRARLGGVIPNLIGGRESTEGTRFEMRSPIDSEILLGTCFEASPAAVAQAIAAARKAFPIWSRVPWEERLRLLEGVGSRLRAMRFELGMAALFEVGKSRFESVGEAEEALDMIPFYAGEMRRNEGFHRGLTSAIPGETGSTRLKPIGVFGIVGPFNFPIAVPINMICCALMTGNTVVYKPSQGAGLTSSLFMRCFLEAGLPEGAVNLVCGGDETGAALIAGAVDGAAFTGSTAAGRDIHAKLTTGGYVKPVIAEMGGKNPTYVTRSADLDVAAEGLARSAFGLQGQKCSSCEVAFVDDAIYDDLLSRLKQKTEAMKVGNPEERDVFVGPLISEDAGARYARAVSDARAGGRIVFGGNRLSSAPFDRGVYVEPLIVEGLPGDHAHVKRELFLPYVTLQRFSDLKDAISRGNAVDYGLCAGFYGRDQAELDTFLDQAEAGVLYANRRSGATTGAWPGIQTFGGWKNSGLTGKNGFGPHYLPLFMREQSHTLMAY